MSVDTTVWQEQPNRKASIFESILRVVPLNLRFHTASVVNEQLPPVSQRIEKWERARLPEFVARKRQACGRSLTLAPGPVIGNSLFLRGSGLHEHRGTC